MNHPLILLIDTSTERGMIALTKGKDLLTQKELPFGLQNAQTLMPCIDSCFQECGLTAQDLQGIAVGVGPGSYTGIRVGVAVAQGLALACDVPWISLCTLECFQSRQDGTFAVLIDAKIGGLYAWKAKREGKVITSLSTSVLLPLGEITNFLHDVDIIVTPHLKPLQPKLDLPTIKHWEEQSAQPHRMAEMALEKYHQGSYSDHVDLLYLRKTQAEINQEAGARSQETIP